mmetsp:Transcript_37308/g.89222  ORF Transcript_37308/g.89222 Transcript_37308/m.89222 type:complete len:612 (+) Transcript_37308:20-1855(+)
MGCGASAKQKYELIQEEERKRKKRKEEAAQEEEKQENSQEAQRTRKTSISTIIRTNQRLVDHYEVEQRGLAFASSQTAGRKPRAISRIVLKQTAEVRACRTVRRRRVDAYSASKEIDVLLHLDHPNIVKVFEVFQDEVNTYMVLQWCEGGKLLSRIQTDEFLTESTVACLTQQILAAVGHMHANQICHRNLDLNHMCLYDRASLDTSLLKVCDFELATVLPTTGARLSEPIAEFGNANFMAPELLTAVPMYCTNVDIWAAGIGVFFLLCGHLPFPGSTVEEVQQQIIGYSKTRSDADSRGSNALNFGDASEPAIDFVTSLLNSDWESRCSAEDAVSLPWLKGAQAKKQLTSHVVKGILSYGNKTLLQKKCMQIIATHLPDEDIKDLVKMFQTLDTNSDGEVSLAELKQAIDAASKKKRSKVRKPSVVSNGSDCGSPASPVKEADLLRLMEAMDSNGDQRIGYTEFLAACLEERHYTQEACLWHAFKYFDRNNDGCISRKELYEALKDEEFGGLLPTKVVNDIVRAGDSNCNQTIDYYEFMALVQPGKGHQWHDFHAANAHGDPKLPPSPVAIKRRKEITGMGTCPKCGQRRQVKDRGDNKGMVCAACWMEL